MHGTTDGQAMTGFINVLTALVMALIVLGVYNLQPWLERWDRDRHFED